MLWTCRNDGQYPGLAADYQTWLGIKQFELRLGYVWKNKGPGIALRRVCCIHTMVTHGCKNYRHCTLLQLFVVSQSPITLYFAMAMLGTILM